MAPSVSMLSVQEVATLTGLSAKAVRGAIVRGELCATKLCGRIRVAPDDLEAWVAAGRIEPSGPTPHPVRAHSPVRGGLREALAGESMGDA